MNLFEDWNRLASRRAFLARSSTGLGAIALASLLNGKLLGEEPKILAKPGEALRPLDHPARTKRIIYLFQSGAPSHIDLFDPKPKLNELNGQKLPDSMTKNIRFAFLQKDSATLLGSPYQFQRYGKCGTEMSGMLPHIGACADDIALVRSMHTEAFNHHPGELL
ncbi:MAG TPA: DUF1501 domain-containing protein, partial [Candidatus Limnocylindria bacterium]|nr:DUF1501 domain-containing protein [Candidatus Limnocylindria bacterium]